MVCCKLCGAVKENRFFKFENGKVRKRTCYQCLGKRDRAKLKLDMIETLGGKCNCCGESNPYFLSLDHVQNDGAKFRASRTQRILKQKTEKAWTSQQIYRRARLEGWPKDKYQLLCMNCNFAKGHFEECPHKLGITPEVALETLKQDSRTIMRTRHDSQAFYTGNQWGPKKP